MGELWTQAFQAVLDGGDFTSLNTLLDDEAADPNCSIEWEGFFLTALFVAVLLQLDDYIPKLVSKGSAIDTLCLWNGLLCAPLHAAALRKDVATLRNLLKAKANASSGLAETCLEESAVQAADVQDPAENDTMRRGITRCNALHILVVRDVFDAEIYTALMDAGARLATSCVLADSTEVTGFALPRLLQNRCATEAEIDAVLGEEIKYTVSMPTAAKHLNALLEVGPSLRGHGRIQDVGYSFFRDVDSRFPAVFAEDGLQPVTALAYTAYIGSSEAARLLLYAGADHTIPARLVLPYSFERNVILNAQACHIATSQGHSAVLEQLIDFGMDPLSSCSGNVFHTATTTHEELWTDLSCAHIAVLAGHPELIDSLVSRACDVNSLAFCKTTGSDEVESAAPLHLAVLQGHVGLTAKLMDLGAKVTDRIRAAAQEHEKVCEMFGGPPVIGLEDWLSALLTGEDALRQLIARRTDLTRPLDWPESTASVLLERHRLASPELIRNLVQTLEQVPTQLRATRPLHLACLLQQPWALDVLAAAGVSVTELPPCLEVPRNQIPLPDGPQVQGQGDAAGALAAFPLDMIFLCVRIGALNMLELLSSHEEYRLAVQREIPLAPDISPPFFPRRLPYGGPEDHALAWAWRRLSPLHYSILHNRIDMAVLLVRLGADLLHTTDHVAVRHPGHYSITDKCFKGLTPLHLCALFGNCLAAAALLNEAGTEAHFTAIERCRPRRQEMLSATCEQAWASVGTTGLEEPWLWRSLTPLHLAILSEQYDIAELFVDASAPETLALTCYQQDVEQKCEKSQSALLMAFDKGLKELHRKIARKFPTC